MFQVHSIWIKKEGRISTGHSPRNVLSESRARREIPICHRWMKAERGRRKREESSLRSLARSLASSLVGRVRKDTEVAPSLSPGETHGTQRLGRSIGDGGHPPPPPLPHSVTLELSVEGHTTCLHTQTCACTRILTHAQVCTTWRREKQRESIEREKEREASRAPWEPRKMFPAYHPPRPLRATRSLDSFSLSRPFCHQ